MGKKLRETDPTFDPNKPFVSVSSASSVEEEPQFDPSQEFTPVKKKDETIVDQPSGSGLMVPEQEPGTPDLLAASETLPKPSEEATERNPFTTIGKSARRAFQYELPASLIGGQMAMEKLPFDLNEVLFKPLFGWLDKYKGMKEVDEMTSRPNAEMDQRRRTMFKQAYQLRSKGQELTKGLVTSLDQAEDWLDYVNWAGYAFGQAAGQIPAVIATRGATAYGQEIGSVYLDAIDKIAQEKGMTPEQVINSGLDESIYPVIFGLGAGRLEQIGAKGVLDSFGKKEVMNSVRSRALGFLKSAGAKEAMTEAGQSTLEQMGVSKAAGKSWIDTFKEIDPNQIKESAAQGFVGGQGLHSGVKGIVKGYQAAKQAIQPKTTKQEVAEQQQQVTSSADTATAEKAADVIQAKVDAQPAEVLTGQVKPEIVVEAKVLPTVEEQKNQPTEEVPLSEQVKNEYPKDDKRARPVLGSSEVSTEQKKTPENEPQFQLPPTVWHGTNKEFTEFKTSGLGVHFGTKSQAKDRGPRLIESEIDLKNPFRIDDPGSDHDMARLTDELILGGIIDPSAKENLLENGTPEDIKNILIQNGYDGIVYQNRNEDKSNPTDSFIVFDTSQIKIKPQNKQTEITTSSTLAAKELQGQIPEAPNTEAELHKIINAVRSGELKISYAELGRIITEFYSNVEAQVAGQETHTEPDNQDIQQLLARLEDDYTVDDVAVGIEELDDNHPQYDELQEAVNKYRDEQQQDKTEFGLRGDPEQYGSEFIESVRRIIKTSPKEEIGLQAKREGEEAKPTPTAFQEKAKELDKTLTADQENLFGERKSEGGLFDVRADPAQREEALKPLKAKVEAAKSKLKGLREKLKGEEGKKDVTLFEKKPEKPETLTAERKRPKPETKKDRRNRLITAEPTSPRQAVLQYFAGGGRINPSSLTEETGMGYQSKRGLRAIRGKEELKKRKRFTSDDAPSIEKLAEQLMNVLPEGADDQDIRNEIIEAITEHETPEAMYEALQAFDEDAVMKAMEEEYYRSVDTTVDAMSDEAIAETDKLISTFNGENDIFDLEASAAALEAGEFDHFEGLVDRINDAIEDIRTSQTDTSPEDQGRTEGLGEGTARQKTEGPPSQQPPSGTGTSLTPPQGERETILKLQDQSNLPEPMKEGIEDFKNYDIRKQAATQSEARRTIDRLGEDEALRQATTFKTGRTQEQKIALLSELANRFAKQFRKDNSQAAYSKFMQAMDVLSQYITDTAQALSYMGLVGQMFETEAGAVRFAKNQIEESREGALKNYDPLKDNAKAILKEMEAEIRRQVEEKVQQTVGERLTRAKLITKEQRKKISDAFDKLLIDTSKGNIVTASVIPGLTLLPEIWNGSVKVMKQAVLTGADVANAIQAGIDYIRDQTKEAFDEEKFKDYFIPFISDLAAKRKEKADKIIQKYLPKDKKKAKKRKEFYDKVIELSDAGALTDQSMDDALAKIFQLPAMTPEIAAKVGEMVDAINKAPEGRFKNIAITKLTDYIAQEQQFSVTNYILASYKAGIFSGIDTQALNMMGNMFNTLELGFMLGLKNPRATARFYKAFGNPKSLSRSTKEALEVLRTGFDPRNTGGTRRALEQRPRSFLGLGKPLKGALQAIDPSLEQQKKYVFRALAAGDLLFSTGINDALQNEMFTRQARKKGLKGKEARQYVMEQMGYTPENIKKAGEQATKEAQSGMIPNKPTDIALRTYEIIEQNRDPEVVQKSRQYASEQIMTNTPKGYIGILARGINQMIQQIPLIGAFIPVVNFAANAMSRAVQYMPHTALAREIVHGVTSKAHGIDFTTQIKDLMNRLKSGDFETEMRLRRAAIGVVALATMTALLSDDEDDENLLSKLLGKKVKIHGFGPGTQLNRQKNYQLQETGWKPYSIQIGDKYFPYQNYPALNVLLATMGEWNDAKRYGKLSNKDADERFLFAMMNSFRVIAEMGFLTSINTLVSSLVEGNVGTFASNLSRTAGGFVPKFEKNLVNLFDNKIYSRNNIRELVTRSIPVLNQYANEPLVNALGEPIQRDWWERVQIWNEDAYSKYEPIWEANAEKKYYFPVPSKFNLEQKFGRPVTPNEYNEYFKHRGEVIIKEFDPKWTKLSKDKYEIKMDRAVRYADYKALEKMGVMESDIMKEIRYQLQDVYDTKKEVKEISKDLNP